jgi:hypothetical protein
MANSAYTWLLTLNPILMIILGVIVFIAGKFAKWVGIILVIAGIVFLVLPYVLRLIWDSEGGWCSMARQTASLGKLAYVLALLGGVVLVVLGLLSFLGMGFTMVTFSMFGPFGGSFWGIIEVVLGVVAIYGAKRVTDLTWAVVLLVIGLVAGGFGGILVLLGGILGLLLHFI